MGRPLPPTAAATPLGMVVPRLMAPAAAATGIPARAGSTSAAASMGGAATRRSTAARDVTLRSAFAPNH